MFQAPFSFDGRIRRTEYGLSYVVYMVVIFFIALILPNTGAEIITLILYIPLVWFMLAQGAKRCHDVGNSGWYQIIPFYFLWLLFQDGEAGENGYGLNPKGIGNEASYDDQIDEIGKSLES
ncbi:DUF805 domain-containing protein [Emticicia sp. BO119]|uniref:DUF805 domain-containing protein n=1 Tax=Emticicia sp. BO119 TaxID=2757768 RepID=UPI0015F041CC|nr:DUF805 domain-containing protein [Emticicia sp. BO119]MBA4852639.1 DUF805 domain-containing protein [Emticicia sp. BO119]